MEGSEGAMEFIYVVSDLYPVAAFEDRKHAEDFAARFDGYTVTPCLEVSRFEYPRGEGECKSSSTPF